MRRLSTWAGAVGSVIVLWGSAAAQDLGAVRTWTYQLADVDPARIARSGFDLAVVDYSRDGTQATALTRAEVAAMRQKPDGGRRVVLAYLSIGEAEDYRYYWQTAWVTSPPRWLDAENPEWKGNFKVRYWDPEWQRIMFGSADAYLDRILAGGFDGVYLDVIDAFEHYEASRPSAVREMVELVVRISRHAKAARPEFLVFVQNGERLLAEPAFLAAIDGIGKEDLFYGYERPRAPSPADEIEFSARFLRLATSARKAVLTVDYVSEPAKVRDAYARSRALGFVPYATVRELDRVVINRGLDPEGPGRAAVESRDRVTPGRFFATTVPRGALRSSLRSEYQRQRFFYEAEDAEGNAVEFRARKFEEASLALALTYGVTDHWEVSVVVPAAYGRFRPAEADTVSGLAALDTSAGLGNVRLGVANGYSWNEGSDNLLLEAEVGLPTDTRSELFEAAGDARLALTVEHYWGRIGAIALAAGNYYAEEDFSGGEVVFEWQLGLGLQLTERMFGSLLFGQEDGVERLELTYEYVTSGGSLELTAGKELGGRERALFLGLSFNFWFEG